MFHKLAFTQISKRVLMSWGTLLWDEVPASWWVRPEREEPLSFDKFFRSQGTEI